MWRLADRGVSARAIGRALNRDHHTVKRHLERDRGEDLAVLLATRGDGRAAREVVSLLGNSVELAAEVNDVLLAYWALRGEERVRLTAIACASL